MQEYLSILQMSPLFADIGTNDIHSMLSCLEARIAEFQKGAAVFLEGDRAIHEPTRVKPSYMGGDHYRLAPVSATLPDYVCQSLRYGLRSFDRKVHGYAQSSAVLSAAETRTSAPVRILRGSDFCAVGNPGIYPCGEGAGYAGGITSAAVDGIKVAEAILAVYAPL